MVDPYAAIRTLPFSSQEIRTPGSTDQEMGGSYLAEDQVRTQWDTDWDSLKPLGFQSKYNEIVDLTDAGYPGFFKVVLQNPDPAKNHKYDTLDAYYQMDPATGQASLVGEPQETRQVSSHEDWRDFAEHGIPIVGGVLLGGYGMAGGTFGLTGAAGAAAGGAATGSGLSLATGGDAGDALKGGLLGAAGGLVKYGANGLLSDVPESNFGNPEADNLISQVGSDGQLLGQLPDGVKQLGTIDPLKQYDTTPLEYTPDFDPNDLASIPDIQEIPNMPGLLDPYAQTVDINSGPGGTKQLGTIDPLKQYDTSPLTPMGTVDPISIPSVPSIPDIKVDSAGQGLLDKVISNPKLIGAAAGALLGGADGGSTDGGSGEAYTGPMPTITRGGWSPTATPTYMNLPTTDYQLPTTGYANSGLWRFNGQQPQTQPAQQSMPQAPQPFQPQQQPLMQQPQPMQPQGLLGTQQPQQPQQQGLMSQGFGRQQRQQGTPADLFSYAQQEGWIDQGGAPVGNWQHNISKLTAAARKMGLNVGGIDQAFGQDPGTTAGYLGTNTLYDGRQQMLDRRAGKVADQEARTQNAGFNRAMARDNGNGTTGRDTYNAYLMRNGIDWQY